MLADKSLIKPDDSLIKTAEFVRAKSLLVLDYDKFIPVLIEWVYRKYTYSIYTFCNPKDKNWHF